MDGRERIENRGQKPMLLAAWVSFPQNKVASLNRHRKKPMLQAATGFSGQIFRFWTD
jgi:hypothetical protein